MPGRRLWALRAGADALEKGEEDKARALLAELKTSFKDSTDHHGKPMGEVAEAAEKELAAQQRRPRAGVDLLLDRVEGVGRDPRRSWMPQSQVVTSDSTVSRPKEKGCVSLQALGILI